MKRYLFGLLAILGVSALTLVWAESPLNVSDFKARPLYRAVELTWKVEDPSRDYGTFTLYRSSNPDGPYNAIKTIEHDRKSASFKYIDREIGFEALYYYKLTIDSTGATYGPISARAYFSPPVTFLVPRYH
ncbi:MAG: hypothetical protein HY878_06720 [Deltaproteobacteria bacterium]|nr:hypothetical protein [Deltaproteobacteria bacterium]